MIILRQQSPGSGRAGHRGAPDPAGALPPRPRRRPRGLLPLRRPERADGHRQPHGHQHIQGEGDHIIQSNKCFSHLISHCRSPSRGTCHSVTAGPCRTAAGRPGWATRRTRPGRGQPSSPGSGWTGRPPPPNLSSPVINRSIRNRNKSFKKPIMSTLFPTMYPWPGIV